MMQGDRYSIGFTVLNNARQIVTPNDVQDVEITIGHLKKSLRDLELTFDDGKWLFPLTQSETFDYWPGATRAQIRIVWANGVIEGKPIHGLRVLESISKEVL